MINVRVLEAQDLPIFNNHLRKTLVSCFSYSSYRFFYGSFKSKKKSTNTNWDCEFNVDFFKLIRLRFFLYGIRAMKSDDYYIGHVTVDFNQFISTSPGNEIMRSPGTSVQNKYPIKSPISTNSKLTLIFTYLPHIKRPVGTRPSLNPNSLIHVYASFSPYHDYQDQPVEVELIQVFPNPDDKTNSKIGYFYHLTKDNSWESVGRSSIDRYFLGPTGPTQVHSLSIPRLSGKYLLFVLDVSNYTGTISLNFANEKSGEFAHFDNKCFIKSKINDRSIRLIKTIDVDVSPNTKYLVPFYLFIQMNSMSTNKYQFNQFLEEHETLTFDKSNIEDNSNLDYADKVFYETEFDNKIIEKVQSIKSLENIHFLRTHVLPLYKQVSLTKLLRNYNLDTNSNLRFYVGGSTTNTAGSSAYVDQWKQGFIAYDKVSHEVCNDIPMKIEEENAISYLPDKVNYNSIITLNLNQIDKNTVLAYYVYCSSYLINAFPHGFFVISHCDDTSERSLFRNTIFADSWTSYYATCFRLEFFDDEWRIIPMRQYFNNKDEMEYALDLAHLNESISYEQSTEDNLEEWIKLEDIK